MHGKGEKKDSSIHGIDPVIHPDIEERQQVDGGLLPKQNRYGGRGRDGGAQSSEVYKALGGSSDVPIHVADGTGDEIISIRKSREEDPLGSEDEQHTFQDDYS